ncbi:NUDIX hydrolase [Pontibacillus yanchengensis]|uniref:NUDIX hydrolase n=1 Tax=Pontibacillus yanchengensis TaxID=462910 RepID=UPI000A5B6B98|nr:NUDIX domain-containing protein [Pontibacillus yanchengensis]
MAICIFQYDEKILVAEGYDNVKGDYFYRPVGGGIEYGEKSSDTLKREVREEISAEITDIEFLGTIENIFTFNGEVGHEIVQVYDASFEDFSFYSVDSFEGIEDNGETFKVFWKPKQSFQNNQLRLVPEALLELI